MERTCASPVDADGEVAHDEKEASCHTAKTNARWRKLQLMSQYLQATQHVEHSRTASRPKANMEAAEAASEKARGEACKWAPVIVATDDCSCANSRCLGVGTTP